MLELGIAARARGVAKSETRKLEIIKQKITRGDAGNVCLMKRCSEVGNCVGVFSQMIISNLLVHEKSKIPTKV